MGDPGIQGEAPGGSGGRGRGGASMWFLQEGAGKAGGGMCRIGQFPRALGHKEPQSHVEPGPGVIRAGG